MVHLLEWKLVVGPLTEPCFQQQSYSKSFINSLLGSFCAYEMILEIYEKSDLISWKTNLVSRSGDVQVNC